MLIPLQGKPRCVQAAVVVGLVQAPKLLWSCLKPTEARASAAVGQKLWFAFHFLLAEGPVLPACPLNSWLTGTFRLLGDTWSRNSRATVLPRYLRVTRRNFRRQVVLCRSVS